jgi:hypothetical protein
MFCGIVALSKLGTAKMPEIQDERRRREYQEIAVTWRLIGDVGEGYGNGPDRGYYDRYPVVRRITALEKSAPQNPLSP